MTDLSLPISQSRFVVVDVESAGGTFGYHRLIEVAMLVVEKSKIVQRFSSLVNPHEDIPEFISEMTGITNSMVRDAPDAVEALAPIEAALADSHAVFVAHNVGFDWGLIARALNEAHGAAPDVLQLCTCKLSRRLHPTLRKHGLDSVADYLGIPVVGRHRAFGDAEATAQCLLKMITTAQQDHRAESLLDLASLQYAPKTTSKKSQQRKDDVRAYLQQIPQEPGVYRFYTQKKKLLYVGKARNLQRRVTSYFHDAPLHGKRINKMIRYVRHIDWTTTGSELGALLLENREIRMQQPPGNVASREFIAPWFITISVEDFPRLGVANQITDDSFEYYGPIRSKLIADRISTMLQRAYQLRSCEGVIVPSAKNKPCFDYHIGRCPAPCATLETQMEYRKRVERAKSAIGNAENGVIAEMRLEMDRAAEELQFERAALYRDGIREVERLFVHSARVPLAIHALNVVVCVVPEGVPDVVEVFALRFGKLKLQRAVSVRSQLAEVTSELHRIYTDTGHNPIFSELELDDLRIITSWLHRHRNQSTSFIYDASIPDQLAQAVKLLSSVPEQSTSH